jgi:hypothetical protein
MFRKFVSVVLMFMFLSFFLYSSGYAAPDGEANGYSGQNIDTNAEYTNGSIPTPYGGIWYVWINVSETKIIQYSLFSNEYNSPIMSFLGQSFQIGNGTEVFIGNTLTLIEVYNDTSGDGIPQANFVSGESETAASTTKLLPSKKFWKMEFRITSGASNIRRSMDFCSIPKNNPE